MSSYVFAILTIIRLNRFWKYPRKRLNADRVYDSRSAIICSLANAECPLYTPWSISKSLLLRDHGASNHNRARSPDSHTECRPLWRLKIATLDRTEQRQRWLRSSTFLET